MILNESQARSLAYYLGTLEQEDYDPFWSSRYGGNTITAFMRDDMKTEQMCLDRELLMSSAAAERPEMVIQVLKDLLWISKNDPDHKALALLFPVQKEEYCEDAVTLDEIDAAVSVIEAINDGEEWDEDDAEVYLDYKWKIRSMVFSSEK